MVGVRELRQNLSVYLARVKRGTTYTVTEHGRIVALLRPTPATDDVIERLVAEGRATPARKRPADLPKALRLKLKVPLSRQLDALREDTV
jgi:antitoxin (DNA-binding transcriptional repressor) of toxin-antitoxin stability system